jgi:hypothetical protein
MKHQLHCAWAPLACALAAALALPAAASAQGFEGVITFKSIDDDGTVTEMKQISKGKKLRIEGIGGSGTWIMDPAKGRMLMIDPEQKQVMVMTEKDVKQMQSMGEETEEKQAKPEDFKVEINPTGQSRTVAGVRCQVWRGYTESEGKREEGEACLAEGVGFAMFDLMANNPMMGGGDSEMEKEFAHYRKVVGPNKGILQSAEIKNGKPVVQLEATKIERSSVSDAQFEPPPGYQVTDMGEMMKAMHQGQQPTEEKPQE